MYVLIAGNVMQMMSPDVLHYSHTSRCARRGPPQRRSLQMRLGHVKELEQCLHA